MKTLTEFFGPALLEGAQLKQELTASGKTPEEIQAAIGEAKKFEGEKLTHYLNVLEIASAKKGIKRVIVSQLGENEKAPAGATQKESFCYQVELFPHSAQATRTQEDPRDARGGGRGGRGDKRGGGGRGGKGRDDRGGGGGRGPRRDSQAPAQAAPTGATGVIIKAGDPGSGESRPAKAARPPREPRAPRPPREPRERKAAPPLDPNRPKPALPKPLNPEGLAEIKAQWAINPPQSAPEASVTESSAAVSSDTASASPSAE